MSDFTTHFVTAHRFLQSQSDVFSEEFKTAFYYGVQGPDLFFFRTPIRGLDGVAFGGVIHDKSPKPIFEMNFEALKTATDFYKGYYFGIMLHFFGDEIMHQYIGYLCTLDTGKHAHIMYERDIDIYTYQEEFHHSIHNVKLKKYYKYSNELAETITDFWKERHAGPLTNKKNVRKCMKNMILTSQVFDRANPCIVGFMKFLDRKKKNGFFTGHFKITNNIHVMNYERNPWQSPEGVRTMSVSDILTHSITNFTNEYNLINKSLAENTPYTFTNTHTFSYGC